MDVMILRPTKGKWILALLLSVPLIAIGTTYIFIDEFIRIFVYEKARGTVGGWMSTFSGGVFMSLGIVGAIGALLQCIPGASELRLSAEGFTVRTLYRSRSYRWEEVSSFHPIRFVRKYVGFEVTGAQDHTRLAGLERTLTGFRANLPDTYGLSAEDLAALMNNWRNQAILS